LKENNTNSKFGFLNYKSEVNVLLQKIDWDVHPLKDPDTWPVNFRTLLSFTLSSKTPQLLIWGKQHFQFFNDAFYAQVSGFNPQPLGNASNDYPLEIWPKIEQYVDDIFTTHEAILVEDVHLPVYKNGALHSAGCTVNFVPIFNEDGAIDGVSATFINIKLLSDIITSAQATQHDVKVLSTIVANSPFPIGIYAGEDLVIDFANKALLEIWGKDKTVIGKKYIDVFPTLSSKEVLLELSNVYKTGIPFEANNRNVHINKNGNVCEYYLNYSFIPLFDSQGTIYAIMSTATDVTALNIAKKKVEYNQSRFYSLVAEAPVATCLFTGRDMKIEIANEKMINLWGKDSSVLGKPLSDAVPELIGQPFLDILDEVFTTGIAYEDRDARADLVVNGVLTTFYFDFTYKPLRDNSGKIYGVMDMAVDVTDKVKARKKLEESEKSFKSLIQEAPVATCFFLVRDMKIEIVNDRMIKLWGKDASIIGKSLVEAVPELVGQQFLDILDNVYNTGVAHENIDAEAELVVDGIKGTYYFDFTYKPVFNDKGEVYGIISMVVDVTNKVIANQQILESQRQLLDSFEQSPVGIALLNRDNLEFIMANTFYGRLVGRNSKEIIGKSLLNAVPELKGQGFDVLLHEVVATGVAYTAKEVSVELHKDGQPEIIYVDLAYQPMRERDGSINAILVVATDVTQQVTSRRKVEASEAKLKSVIATAPAGMGLFVGRDLIVEMPNQTFIDIVGKGWDIVGKPLWEAMPELLTEGQPFLKILDDVFTTGKMYHSQGSQVKIIQNGVMTYNYYNITYTPILDENGEVYAILDIAIDVTDTILARQKAEEAMASLRGAIELAELAAWTLNIKDNTFTFSPRFLEWLGVSNNIDAEIGLSTIPEEYRLQIKTALENAIAPDSTGLYHAEHPVINVLTGEKIIVNSQAQVFYDALGVPEFLTGTARDVTKERELQQLLESQVKERTEKLQYANAELEEANNSLQKSNSELGQFAYIASHDLQEPIRKISIFIKMLEEKLAAVADEKSKYYIERIEQSAERMTSLIKDILGYSQLSKENEVFEIVDLNTVAKNIITDFELIIEQKNATINYNNLPLIKAVPLQMTQLFANLISNSLKYSKQDVAPIINIESSILTSDDITYYSIPHPPNLYFKIIFSDNGIGFNQDYAQQIFSIFQRLHTKSEFTGTGIGLAMCKKIAQNHNGEIYAFSKEGKGAEFVVVLPLEK
jgi:PAS domain S-box-containing protein